MELRQLESFLCVARHGHITRAARELFLTQPALSQQIRRLEQELGVTLLTRTAHGVQLTPAGADLAERAAVIVAEVARARGAMDDHAGARRGIARVAAAAADARGLPAALASFAPVHPQIRIALRQGSEQEVLTLLTQGAVDLAITTLPAPPGTVGHALAEDQLVLVAAADRGSVTERDSAAVGAGERSDTISALREQPLVLAGPGTALRTRVLALCQDSGFSPVPLLEASDPASVLALARASLGVAVVPLSWTSDGGAEGLVVTPLHPAASLSRALLTAGDPETLSPAAGLLHAHLVAQLGP